MRSIPAIALGFLLAAASLSVSGAARAEPEFDVAIAGGAITVIPKSGWHINKDFPWKLQQNGTTTMAKDKFELSETKAKLGAATKGKGVLKGAVCSSGNGVCKQFEKEVTVN